MSRKRVIVAQPASLCRDGAGLLQVGVLRWTLPPHRVKVEETPLIMAGFPVLSFVVKATYSYAKCAAAGDEPVLADEPEGMALDVPSELDGAAEGEMAYPSDFVPRKEACDVLVTGHAFSKRPLARIPAHFKVGTVERAFEVESPIAAVKAPLVAAAIRAGTGAAAPSGSPGLGVASVANRQSAPGQAEPVGPSPTPALLEDYPLGFDFEAYSRAPASQRIAEPSGREEVVLTGLSERASTLRFRLPKKAPVVWVDTVDERGSPMDMTCDTVWIDTDRQLVVMAYRGIWRVPDLDIDGVTQVIVSLAEPGPTPARLADVQDDLARGVFEMAVELDDFDEEGPPPQEPSLFSRYEMWEKHEEPTISLERYALIAAALAEGTPPRGETLRAHGFDEEGFLLEERGWLGRMAETAMKDEAALATRYGELFVEAQDRLAGPGEGKESVTEYAMLKVDIEDAADPQQVLEARKISLALWMRMDRRWTRRANEDPRVEAEIQRCCEAYRARVETAGKAPLRKGEG